MLHKIWAPRALFRPQGTSRENDQASAHLGSKGFHMAFAFSIIKMGPVVSKICRTQIWSHNSQLEPQGPRRPIFYTLLTVVPMSCYYKKKFIVNHAENFANFMKTWILTYFAPFQVKKQSEYMDPRVHDLHTLESSSDIPVKQVSWSYSKNFWENGQTQTPCKLVTLYRPENTYIHNFFEFETWLHPLPQYVAVGFLFAQLEILWNGLHTAIGTDH